MEGDKRRLAAILAADIVGYSRLTALAGQTKKARLLVEHFRERFPDAEPKGYQERFPLKDPNGWNWVLDGLRTAGLSDATVGTS